MRFRTWPVAALGLGGLLLLVVVSVLAASNRAQQIYTRLDELNTHHREVENMLRLLRSDLSLSGIYIRDYLLDPERARSSDYRYQLAQYRQSNVTTVAKLRELMAPHTGHDERLVSLDAKLDEYWQAFEPLFDWTPSEKMLLSSGFLKHEVLPRREAVLTIALQIEALNNSNHSIQRAEIARQYAEFRSELQKLLWGSLLLGFIVAMTAVIRLRILERRSEEERAVTEEAERQMRQLSQQLVATQEEERKKLSRELHDHVGQMLTALRMELGRIDRLRSAADRVRQVSGESGSAVLSRERDAGAEASVAGAVVECRQLVDNMVRTRPRSRAGPPAEHARRLRPAAGARMAREGLQSPVRRAGRADDGRRLRSPDRSAPDVRVSRGAGSADQLRQARARAADSGQRDRRERRPQRVDFRRWHRAGSRAESKRTGPAGHRRARARAPRRDDDPQRGPTRARR